MMRESVLGALLNGLGRNFEDFSMSFNLTDVLQTEHFVARESDLMRIHKTLSGDSSRRVAILHGPGGIGKTQLAIAYAKQYRVQYSAIFWLNIKDEESLKQSFAKVARRILQEHPSASRIKDLDLKETLDNVIDAVNGWLTLPNNSRWLLVYDNYDNPQLRGKTEAAVIDIERYLPESYQGSIIITTRSSEVKIGHQIQIRKLDDIRDSLNILANTSERDNLISGKLALEY